jgi:hypothetical protein
MMDEGIEDLIHHGCDLGKLMLHGAPPSGERGGGPRRRRMGGGRDSTTYTTRLTVMLRPTTGSE